MESCRQTPVNTTWPTRSADQCQCPHHDFLGSLHKALITGWHAGQLLRKEEVFLLRVKECCASVAVACCQPTPAALVCTQHAVQSLDKARQLAELFSCSRAGLQKRRPGEQEHSVGRRWSPRRQAAARRKHRGAWRPAGQVSAQPLFATRCPYFTCGTHTGCRCRPRPRR